MYPLIKTIVFLLSSSIYAMESVGEVIPSSAAAGAGGGSAAPKYNLLRHDGDEKVMEYTSKLKTREGKVFNLLDDYAKSRLKVVSEKSEEESFKTNHMFGRLIFKQFSSYTRYKTYTLDFDTKLFDGIPGYEQMPTDGKSLSIDWVSSSSKWEEKDESFYYKTTYYFPILNLTGHSEAQFIKDYMQLWRTRPGLILDKLVPTRGNSEFESCVYFSAMQLFSTFDSCDDCLNRLKSFKSEYLSHGQKSLVEAIKNHCILKNVQYHLPKLTQEEIEAAEKKHGLMIFNSAYPYSPIESYRYAAMGAIEETSLKYKYKKLYMEDEFDTFYRGSFTTEDNPLQLGSTLSYLNIITDLEDVIYGNIAMFNLYKPKCFAESGFGFDFIYSSGNIFNPKKRQLQDLYSTFEKNITELDSIQDSEKLKQFKDSLVTDMYAALELSLTKKEEALKEATPAGAAKHK